MLARMSLLTTRRPLSPRAGRASSSSSSSSSSISSLFRPWPQSVVTSHGDYRDEAWLEKHIGGPLYEHQQSLPRLPIPEIHETMARLASTALPLAKTPEEATQLQRALEIFPQQAAHLQKRLLERKQEMDATDSSWLQLWWNTLGYLQVRDSSMINVSYFFHFADDPHAHSDIQRGAALLQAAMRVRKQVASGQMPADCIGRPPKQTPLCSVAYKYMFHATRIPQLQQDTYELHDPSLHNHVVVSCRGQFYKLTVCDPQTGEPYSLATLEAGLEQIKQYAATNTHNNNTTGSMELGWLTSMNRDDWAKARQTLLNKGGSRMQEALTTLESGALLLCLDDQEAPVSRAEVAKLHLWGGGATMEAGANRWFDKSVQLMVSQNAKAGFMGEHSMMDGMPCVGLADAFTKMTYDKCLAMETSSGTTMACVVEPIFDQALAAIGQDTVAPLVNKAKQDYMDLVSRHSLNVQSFQGYGSDFIKHAGFSPDAYVQMAMQVATYRLWGEQAGTYEATQVRPFLHGRTETTRSVSTQSAAFCQRMGLRPLGDDDDAQARTEKVKLLRDAVDAHVKYIGLAAKAQGVDRHLFGLSLVVNDGEKAPDLYSDPTFIRAKRWRVSTSHLTHPKFDGWGYGEVYPDGVGLAYSIHKRHCIFNITALSEHGWTDKLSNLLEEVLLEIRTLLEMDKAANQPGSKL